MAFKRPERSESASLPRTARLGGAKGVYHVRAGLEVALRIEWLAEDGGPVYPETSLSIRGPGGARLEPAVTRSGDALLASFTPDRAGQWWYAFETPTASARGCVVCEPR